MRRPVLGLYGFESADVPAENEIEPVIEMESCVGECKMKMEGIKVNEPAEHRRPAVKRGGENGGGMNKLKVIMYILAFICLQTFVTLSAETLSASQTAEIVKKIRSGNDESVKDVINLIKEKPEITRNLKIREQLIRLIAVNERHYTPVMRVLKMTRDGISNRKEIRIKFNAKEKNVIIGQIKSNDRKKYFDGYNKIVHAFATNRNNDLVREKAVFVADRNVLLQLDKNLDKGNRFSETDHLVADYLRSYEKKRYEKRIRMFLLQSTIEACENTLMVLERENSLLKKHADDVVDLVNSSDNSEIRTMAIRLLKTLNNAEVLAKITPQLLDLTPVINGILTAYKNKDVNSILALAEQKYGLIVTGNYWLSRHSFFPYDLESVCGSAGTTEDAKRFLEGNNCLSVFKNSVSLSDNRIIEKNGKYALNADLSSIDHTGHFYRESFFLEPRFDGFKNFFSINFYNADPKYDFSEKCRCHNKVIAAICGVKNDQVVFLGMTGADFNID